MAKIAEEEAAAERAKKEAEKAKKKAAKGSVASQDEAGTTAQEGEDGEDSKSGS